MADISKSRIAILVSGNGSNLQAIMDAIAADTTFPATIVRVISNKAEAYALERAQMASIPTHVIDHTAYANRDAFDQALHNQLIKDKVDVICLAGFMRLLTASFVNQWKGKILNIHPSLLPDFKGAHAIRDAFEAGVSHTGCTVHIVTPEMDAGPILGQYEVEMDADDTLDTIETKMHQAEHQLYPAVLRQFIENIQ